jgi:hypothetical protein
MPFLLFAHTAKNMCSLSAVTRSVTSQSVVADVSSCGRRFLGRAAAKARAMRAQHPDMSPVWHPLSHGYLKQIGGRVYPWRLRSPRLLVDGIPFVNAADVVFSDVNDDRDQPPVDGNVKKHTRSCQDNWWVRAGSASSHAYFDGGIQGAWSRRGAPAVDLFGHPLALSQVWDPFCRERLHQPITSPCVSLADVSSFQLTLAGSCAMKRAPPSDAPHSTFVPLDCVKNGAALLDLAHITPPPQILTIGGGVTRIKCSLPLAVHLHQESPHTNLWFEIPASVVQGGSPEEFLATFPFSLKLDNVQALDISEFKIPRSVTETVEYVIPLSSIEEEDHDKAVFIHEYVGVSITGKHLTRDSLLGAATLAQQEKYDSAMWVSTTIMDRHQLAATSEEPLGFLSPLGTSDGIAMVNLDVVQPVSHRQWVQIYRQVESVARDWRDRRNQAQ